MMTQLQRQFMGCFTSWYLIFEIAYKALDCTLAFSYIYFLLTFLLFIPLPLLTLSTSNTPSLLSCHRIILNNIVFFQDFTWGIMHSFLFNQIRINSPLIHTIITDICIFKTNKWLSRSHLLTNWYCLIMIMTKMKSTLISSPI